MDAISEQIIRFESDIEKIAYRMAQGFGPSLADELIQAGRCGTWAAIQSYNASLGATLKTHVINKARYAMTDYLRETDHVSRTDRKKIKSGLIVDPIEYSYSGLDADIDSLFYDAGHTDISTPDQYLAAKEAAEIIDTFIAKHRYGDVFKRYAIDGDALKSIATDYDVGASQVSLYMRECCRDLSRKLGYKLPLKVNLYNASCDK